VVVVAPAEQRQIVDQRLGQVALAPKLVDTDRAVPFRELLAVGPEHVSDVGVDGNLGAERLQHADLLGRVGDVIVAADDVRDAVEPVVERRGEVVGRAPVGAQDDEILQLLTRDFDRAAHRVVPAGHANVRHADPDRALVLVGLALLEQAACLDLAALATVELEGDRPVPVEAEPGERLLDLLGRLGDLAAGVGVLDPQVKLAAEVTGEKPVEKRGANATDVEEAGRRRSEADFHGHGGIVDARFGAHT